MRQSLSAIRRATRGGAHAAQAFVQTACAFVNDAMLNTIMALAVCHTVKIMGKKQEKTSFCKFV